MSISIPHSLKAEVENGTAVLVLGAGASLGAVSSSGSQAPSTRRLSEEIAKRFLGEPLLAADHQLDEIVELAQSASDLYRVQNFIRSLLTDLQPLPHHLLIPTFRWHGIATTNYDLLIETGYSHVADRAQSLVSFLRDGEHIDERIRHEEDAIPLLKLHGCITRTEDADVPLILTVAQYITHSRNRVRLFNRFADWASEHTVVFVGYSLKDPDVRSMLKNLTETLPSRPRYYVVTPSPLENTVQFWDSKRVSTIDGTAGEFFTALDSLIGKTFRSVRRRFHGGPLGALLPAGKTVTSRATAFFTTDIDIVRDQKIDRPVAPADFYRGLSHGWAPIEQQLDVRRKMTDALLTDYFIDDALTTKEVRLVVVKAHAGSGKSVFLRRLAWDAAHTFNSTVLWLRRDCAINTEAMIELSIKLNSPLFLFVDDILVHTREVVQLLERADEAKVALTVIGASRTNEWNSASPRIVEWTTAVHELHFLSEGDVNRLLELLARHRALGQLERLDHAERVHAFIDRAARQLLVALHEATLGRPFEEILVNEYNGIQPELARRIYLTVCMLCQFGVRVRAGIISRLHGVSFREFEKNFFHPLEEVVKAEFDNTLRDYVYTARHRHIAEIVVREVLRDPKACHEEIVRSITHLNLDYDYDRVAFNNLIRARGLTALLGDPLLVRDVYREAADVSGAYWQLSHQQAIFEMQNGGADSSTVEMHLEEALRLSPNNFAVLHTTAELRLAQAKKMPNRTMCDRKLSEAEAICVQLKKRTEDTHPYHTMMKIGVERLKRALQDEEASDSELENIVVQIDRERFEAIAISPNDEYIFATEAQLAELFEERGRARRVLEQAWNRNRGSGYIAVRLARIYVKDGDKQKALKVMREALEAKSGDRVLHFELASILAMDQSSDLDEVIYHFSRSFRPGDKNVKARFLHASYVCERDGVAASKPLFGEVKLLRSGLPSQPYVIRDIERAGSITKLFETSGMVSMDGRGEWVFMHESNVGDGIWDRLGIGMRVRFVLGYTYKGPIATGLRI